MSYHVSSSPTLPSAPLFSKLFGDGIVRFALFTGALYTGYGWWALDMGWGWCAAWSFLLVAADNAHRRVRRIEAYSPIQGPTLCTRMFGHPVLAVPVLIASMAWMAFVISQLADKGVTLETAEVPHLLTLALFALPILIFGRWFLLRQQWRSRNPPADARQVNGVDRSAPSPRPIPTVKLLLPKAAPVKCSVLHSMQHLPPHLLELVRTGTARVGRELAET
ncbi:hypothetical protein KHC28_01465 [Ancylobacter sonchi]|uniref:hypothetical protein n=1 Tax=Ancylobacter sonchi TaxID=1937790 RepID=UPI001BD65B1D|nr:hypothetical protein [Ancylobacter sonchi]MBS7532321.1 hypothetical protein [Ancylobacter sonchi]